MAIVNGKFFCTATCTPDHKATRESLISEIAEFRVGEIDSATLMELSLDAREDLDATIARMERVERKRLAKLRTEKLWQLHEEIS